MEKRTYKEFIESQSEIRVRLFKIIKENPIPMRKLAKEIEINMQTLLNFLRDEKDVDFIRLSKIEKWIKKHER